MSKRPGPWTCTDDIVRDSSGASVIYFYTDDPETRAVLLHAGDMWQIMRATYSGNKFAHGTALALFEEIEAEIAKGKP